MPKADAELIRQLAYEGKSTPEIARIAGVSNRTVERHKPAELKEYHGRGAYPPEVREAAKALLEDRAGYLETSRSLGVDYKTVQRWFPGYALTRKESLERALLARHYPLDKIGGLNA